jgi:hypothetical protein
MYYMKFTLKLTDYLDQYKINKDEDCLNCPVCYNEEITGDIEDDVTHIIGCYKDQEIELRLLDHMNKTGEFPEIDEFWVDGIIQSIELEIIECTSKI